MAKAPGSFERHIIRFFGSIHPLERVPRAGFLLRGVSDPESVAAHSHFLALLVMLFTERYPDRFEKGKAIEMALVHDIPEAVLMDIPMPVTDLYFKKEKLRAERNIMDNLFSDLTPGYTELMKELDEKSSPEARLVSGLDKAQMMLKVLAYEKEKRGNLEEFWMNPANFEDYGIEEVSRLFDEICRISDHLRPRI
ncbi:MAG: HD domain-containing protein [Spirochaetales bacterium]|nr:HD domain-containing protein [Spirochaetales bacterium]